jgi:hypothetical protein
MINLYPVEFKMHLIDINLLKKEKEQKKLITKICLYRQKLRVDLRRQTGKGTYDNNTAFSSLKTLYQYTLTLLIIIYSSKIFAIAGCDRCHFFRHSLSHNSVKISPNLYEPSIFRKFKVSTLKFIRILYVLKVHGKSFHTSVVY